MSELLFAFYGDDFTGSTDALEALTLGGIPAVLFLEPPDLTTLSSEFPDVRAIGVAGISRSMSPEQMEAELRPKFKALKALGAPFYHYKVCSTFDSSPQVGSIGQAIDVGHDVFGSPIVPLMVGAPALRRYVTFGNLFATVKDKTYRIDRHPTMSKHPITPMDEGDLRLHLGKQTQKSIGLIDLLSLNQGFDVARQCLDEVLDAGTDIILFDTVDTTHVQMIGELIGSLRGDHPIFIAGSSGVEYALTTYWQSVGLADTSPNFETINPAEQVLVMSGSASPVTQEQITWAIENGFETIRLNAPQLVDDNTANAECDAMVQQALDILQGGKNLVLYSALGPDDPAIRATAERLQLIGIDPTTAGERLGTQQGKIFRRLLENSTIRRACVAGGDTCGHTIQQLNIYALKVIAPLAPGSPLCRVSSHDAQFDGLEITLKGGQVGQVDFFGRVQGGHEAS